MNQSARASGSLSARTKAAGERLSGRAQCARSTASFQMHRARVRARVRALFARLLLRVCGNFVRRGCFVGDAATVVAQRRLKWSRLQWSQLRWQRQRNVDRVAAAAAARTGVVHRLRCSLTCCALIYYQAQYFRRQAKQISSVGSL